MKTNIAYRADLPTDQKAQIDYIVLDGSSSMNRIWWDALGSIDAYVDGLRAAKINTHIKLTTFDSGHMNYPHRDAPLESWVPLRDEPIGAFGGITPLYDAIALVGRELRDLDPPKASIVFVTDGAENGSRHTDLVQAKSIIKWMEAKGWTVTFIGCNFDNTDLANMLGVTEAQAIGVTSAKLTDAGKALSRKRVANAIGGAPMHWSDDERQRFGGYLGGPSA
jgi:hypothetical protein